MIKLEDFPKGKEKIREFAKECLLGLQKMVNKDTPQGTELPPVEDELVEYYINNILTNNKRALYEVFDKEDIHLLIDYADGFYWQVKYRVNNITNVQIGDPPVKFDDRVSCEEEGFAQCLKIYESL